MSKRRSAASGDGGAPLQMELTGDVLRLHTLMERGHPILRSKIGQLLHNAGSTTVRDEPTFLVFWRSAAGKAAQAELDLEFKLFGKKIRQQHCVVWKGNKPIHCGSHKNPPKDHGVRAFLALQDFIDAHRTRGGRGTAGKPVLTRRLEGRALGGDAFWSPATETCWKKVVLPALLPGGQHFHVLNHELRGATFPTSRTSREQETWVLDMIEQLDDFGAIDLGPRERQLCTASGGGSSKVHPNSLSLFVCVCLSVSVCLTSIASFSSEFDLPCGGGTGG
eukprot:SAG31_NODE_2894_length_4941_cov_45.155340_2_plen_278_part_00